MKLGSLFIAIMSRGRCLMWEKRGGKREDPFSGTFYHTVLQTCDFVLHKDIG